MLRQSYSRLEQNSWESLQIRHSMGATIIAYRKSHPSPKSNELLQQLANMAGDKINYKFLQLVERFAKRFPDFDLFKTKYAMQSSEPFSDIPSWTDIIRNFLYEQRRAEPQGEELETEEGVDENGHSYRRTVINLKPLDKEYRLEECITRAAQKRKILPSNYLRGCVYGLWDLHTDSMIDEQQLEHIELELINREERTRKMRSWSV